MTVRVGVVGVGVMGADHARKLNGCVAGADVTAIADVLHRSSHFSVVCDIGMTKGTRRRHCK